MNKPKPTSQEVLSRIDYLERESPHLLSLRGRVLSLKVNVGLSQKAYEDIIEAVSRQIDIFYKEICDLRNEIYEQKTTP